MLCLAGLFGDHAVLQCDLPIPVWGWARPGTIVYVKLSNGAAAAGLASDSGKFMVRLPAQNPGGPFRLSVETASGEHVDVNDVYIGEVWLAGGQSNMEMPLNGFETPVSDIEKLAFGAPVRMLTVPRATSLTRAENLNAAWTLPDGHLKMSWSAVGAFFAARLSRELNVPVGIIAANWGGTPVEAWTSREKLMRNPALTNAVLEYEDLINRPSYWHAVAEHGIDDFTDAPYETIVARNSWLHYPEYPANSGEQRQWQQPDCDDENWGKVQLPGSWQELGIFQNSGVIWFRKHVRIPPLWRGRSLRLELGAADKHDVTYVNGVRIGATGSGVETCFWNVIRNYEIPPEATAGPELVIAVRVYSFMYAGGLTGPAENMKIYPSGTSAADAVPLCGQWKWQLELDIGKRRAAAFGLGNPTSYGILFDDMIAPLIPYAMRGAIWYQGETNAPNYGEYRRLMADLISDWRERWGQQCFDFYQVLLAGFDDPQAAHWPEIREAQLEAAAETGTGFASAIDLGEAGNIHPHNKYPVGERLAAAALLRTYGRTPGVNYPQVSEIQWCDHGVKISVDHAEGLHVRGQTAGGWELAADGINFVPAQMVSESGQLFVFSPQVAHPNQVRYAWQGYPAEANLYNSDGLPMLPFRAERATVDRT